MSYWTRYAIKMVLFALLALVVGELFTQGMRNIKDSAVRVEIESGRGK